MQQMVSKCYLFAQLLVYRLLPLVLKLPQTNHGDSTYFHRALMLTAYLYCEPIVNFKALKLPLNIKIFQ